MKEKSFSCFVENMQIERAKTFYSSNLMKFAFKMLKSENEDAEQGGSNNELIMALIQ